jgi:hypothetical protein
VEVVQDTSNCGLSCGLEIREQHVRLFDARVPAIDLPMNAMIA